MVHDSLGNRMKVYEDAFRHKLPIRVPVIIRVDGRAFHTLTRNFQKPFDPIMEKAMDETAIALCQNVCGCKLAFVESDEISLVLTNHDTINTAAWFDNNIQKLASVTASIATAAFNKSFADAVREHAATDGTIAPGYAKELYKATFDSRSFVLPDHEVTNYFIWRQKDAVRCSINSYAQSMFPHNALQGKSCNEMQEMMFQKSGFNWNDAPTHRKRGRCVIKDNDGHWVVDYGIPDFVVNRVYIESRVPLAGWEF